jgi:GAF domain-containing protein
MTNGMVPVGIADVAPWRTWDSAAEGLLLLLHEHVGWDVWMVTRVVGDRQIILRSCPEYAVPPGTELSWERSLCRQMIEGRGPRLATVTAAVPAYADRARAPIRDIAAYVGVPLVAPDLTLFGTLCGVAIRAQPRSAARELDVVEGTARVLSTLMAAGLEPPAIAGSPASVQPAADV